MRTPRIVIPRPADPLQPLIDARLAAKRLDGLAAKIQAAETKALKPSPFVTPQRWKDATESFRETVSFLERC